MRAMLLRPATWRLLALLASIATPVAAAPRPPIALEYEAPTGCPDRAAYVSRVRVHGGGAALTDAPGRVFVVRIEARDGQYAGAVTIVAGPDQTRRAIEAADCVELVDALAPVTVIALDPLAADGAPPAGPSAPRGWEVAIGAGATGVLARPSSASPRRCAVDDRRLLDDPAATPLERALLASARGDAPTTAARTRIAAQLAATSTAAPAAMAPPPPRSRAASSPPIRTARCRSARVRCSRARSRDQPPSARP
jgi:hypothetical protein